MFRDFSSIITEHDWRLIALAGAVCLLSSLVAVSLFQRARARKFARARQKLLADAEDQLRERNVRLDAALNNMSQGLCMFDASARIVLCNRRFLEMYHLSPDVVKPGCTLLELIRHRVDVGLLDADPEQHVRAILENIRDQRQARFMVPLKDGRMVQSYNRSMPGGGWVTTHEDVTERLKAADLLHEQRLQLDAALNNMSQGLVMFDSQTRLIVCNERYRQMYHLQPEDTVPGRTLPELLEIRRGKGTFSRDLPKRLQELQADLALGRATNNFAELADGRLISILNSPMADGWVSTHEDITERRQADKLLREQKLQLDTALNNMTQGLNMFDAEGRLVVCNERYRKMYRLSRDDIRPGRTAAELIQARVDAGTFFTADAKEYAAELLTAMTRQQPTDATLELTDGRLIAVVSRPAPDGSGWVVTHEDITERRRAEQERDRSQAFASSVIENVPATILVKNARDRRYVLVNRAGENYFGLPRDKIIGKLSSDVMPQEVAAKVTAKDEAMLENGEMQFHDEHPSVTFAGDPRVITTTRIPIMAQDGALQYLLTVIEDRTNRKRAEAKIAHMAHHDMLTGIPNRAAFNECVASTIADAAANGGSFALMSLDIDRLKETNDVFGHAVGDGLLCEVSRRVQKTIGGGFIARLGGDEFAVIATDGVQPAAAKGMADRLVAAMAEEFVIDGHHLRSGLSIGIAVFPDNGEDATALVANADAALYRAKAEGRGIYRFFEPGMDLRLRERHALQQDMQGAIERREFALYYQPQARIDRNVVGFEALVRWMHPTRGMVSPADFIPLAEESGFIVAMGEWVLREACREAASWRKPLQIAINLSPVQFRHGDLAALVHSVLLETGLPPSRLELEITEGVLIGDFSRAVAILRRLKALGVRIAMDDFGTGYSSLSYLQSFPFDKIKIDRTFISNLEHNPQSATIIRAVIGLARGLALPVIAEGVETEAQLAFLAHEKCDELQGYLIGRPLPIADYAAMTGQPTPLRPRAALGAAAG